ncbi:MAG TPA: hypothetical protein VKF59_20310 [Candidatus Dormibacteraeota bacterium]|nr:hypothetical protein [Candidatus Dormibacteraeota bacterium]
MIQRDYIERLIQQCAEFLGRILRLREAGELDPALRLVDEAANELLGPLRPLLDRLEASTAVEVAGRLDTDRIRLYAALLGEQALIHGARGDAMRAYLSCRRALELLAAVSLAGGRLGDDDLRRIAVLTTTLDVDQLDDRYRDELRRLAARGERPR